MLHSVVLIIALLQSDSDVCMCIYVYIYTHTVFHILFPYGLSQVIEYSSVLVPFAFFPQILFCLFYLFYWHISDLQYCVSFRYTAKWFSLYLSTYIHLFIYRYIYLYTYGAFLNGKESTCNIGNLQEKWVWSLCWEDSLEEEMATPFQYSCLENSMGRGTWPATVHGAAKSWTWLISWANSKQRKTREQGVTQKCARRGFSSFS